MFSKRLHCCLLSELDVSCRSKPYIFWLIIISMSIRRYEHWVVYTGCGATKNKILRKTLNIVCNRRIRRRLKK